MALDDVYDTVPRPLKIVYVITRMVVGGAQETTKYMAEHFCREGHEVLLVMGPETGPEGRLEADVPTVVLPTLVRRVSPVADLRTVWLLYRLFRRERPDIVQSQTAKARFVAPVAARLARVPSVIQTIHGFSFNNEIDRYEWLYLRLERIAARMCHWNVFVSDADLEEAERRRIVDPDKATVIRSGVDLEKMMAADSSGAADLRAEYEIPGGKIVTLLGRLSSPKTPEVFVDAAALVVKHHPETRFLLVGDGAKKTAIKARIARLGLERSVFLLGLRMDAPELVAASDVVVHSSTHEGLPKTIHEAIAAGKPVIATAVGGIPAVLENGVTGLLVSPLDPEGLAAAMTSLIEDERLGQRLAAAALQTLPEFGVERTMLDAERLYERLRDANPAGKS